MREQGKRAVRALMLAAFLASSAVSNSAAAGDVNSPNPNGSAAELLLLTMLLAAAMTTPAEAATVQPQPIADEGGASAKAQMACAAPVKPGCSEADQSAW
ncbi:MAG: hypothetical protein K0S81_504 [Rhodospirillales bacterium]|nr:hypothetical protein [Rhodospirillales bacterium]